MEWYIHTCSLQENDWFFSFSPPNYQSMFFLPIQNFPIIPFRQGGLRPVELGLLTMINIRPAEKLFWMTCFRLAVCGLTPGSAEGNCHESCEPIGPIGIAEISHIAGGQRKHPFPLNSPQNSKSKNLDLICTSHMDRKPAQHVAHNLFGPSTWEPNGMSPRKSQLQKQIIPSP